MLFSTVFIFLPAWYLLLPLRNHGLWLAFVLFMTARAISMAVLMRRVSARAGFHI
jgi:MATE family multidrug resistance protein